MRVRGALQAAALLASALWATPLLAKNDEPAFKATKVDHRPTFLNYFPESDIILYQDMTDNNVYRSDDGGETWGAVKDVPDGKAYVLLMHEHDPKRAYIVTQGTEHYRTADRGKSWQKFKSIAEPDFERPDILQFHAGDPDRIIFNGLKCKGIMCELATTYTTDGFDTEAKDLRSDASGCWWAKSSDLFDTKDEDLNKNRILCIVLGEFSFDKQDRRLLISDNFFKPDSSGKIQEFEPNLDGDKAVRGVVNVAVVKRYLLVASTSANTDEMALFVTTDTKKWQRAMFPATHDSHDHRVLQEAYTVLESTNYSIQVDVMTGHPSNPMGVMFTSNYDGTYFTENIEHTNRNPQGHVDFEKITGIQGIFLVNKVDNWEKVDKKSSAKKEVVSEITFDDGRTFEAIHAGKEKIHLHSVTDLNNVGRVFSSPAPGLVMANGNTGDYLKDYWKDANLYVSDDAGRTWSKALDGPHKYEFGDQGSILLAVKDSQEEDVDKISYSLDHGQNWKDVSLPDDLKIKPYILTTTQDSTTLKFILIGKAKKSYHIISIDFEGLHESKCKDEDMEDWSARVDDDGKPTCIMGHTQSYRRRKKNSECFLKQEFKHAVPTTKECDCTDVDFECDYNFVREDGKCVSKGPIAAPEKACRDKKPDDTFMGTSGYRKIPGNTCKSTKETDEKYKEIEHKCSEIIGAPSAPATGKLKQTENKKFGEGIGWEKHYLSRGESSTEDDETIVMRPWKSNEKPGPIYISHDHGESWLQPKALEDDKIEYIIPHAYVKDMVFFITDGKKVIYTTDRGHHFHSFKAPLKLSNNDLPLIFHPDKKDWLMWVGVTDDDDDDAYRAVSYSKDRGDHWETRVRYAGKCEFTGANAYKFPDRKVTQIVCTKREKDSSSSDHNPFVLFSTDDWFDNTKELLKDVKDFATMSEFIVAATEDSEKETLVAYASLDGSNFAEAKFPHGFEVSHQHAYTVLDSSTHAVNLFVVTDIREDHILGTILKSNSNGTSYVVSVRDVNANRAFYVDYEKMLGLEGVALVNVVTNPEEKGSAPKKLRTKITHNDGSMWAYLTPPVKDELGDFPCKSSTGTEKCALHIHGFSERSDHSKTHSIEGAVGFMFGWGNVGEYLTPQNEADTFMTSDAGITWKRVKKGLWTWAFGDQGSIIVLAQTQYSEEKSNVIFYSVDQGETWQEHKFSEEKVQVMDITTLHSGNSRKFLLWCKDGDKLFTVTLDFTGFSDHQCKAEAGDYDIWSPSHPLQETDCLFGHKTLYQRKKPGKTCFNDFRMQPVYERQNCSCTRADFEW